MIYPNAYCVKCGGHTETLKKHTVMLQSSARAVKGVCPQCASDVYRIVPKGRDFVGEAAALAKTVLVPPPAAPAPVASRPTPRRHIPVAPRAALVRHAESVHTNQLPYVIGAGTIIAIILGVFAYAVV